MDRRSFMKASGVAAALGVTGLAGCSGILGSSSGASNWQYDPATLAETQTRFFGSMQYGNLYSMRDELPGTMGENFEVDTQSPINPEDIDLLTGVGGGQISMQTGSGAFFGSVALTGSYDVDAISSQMMSEGSVQENGEYEGYTLYSGTNLNQQVPGDQMPTGTDATATAALSEEAMVLGVTVSQSGSLDVSGQDTVETMIDAKAGNAPRIDANSKYAKKLHNKLGGATMVVGGEVDGALDEHAVDGVPLQVHPEDVLGGRAGLVGVVDEFDAAGLPAPADLDLRLHRDGVADVLGGVDDLVGGGRERGGRRRDARLGEDVLRLVLVELHWSWPYPASGGQKQFRKDS